ncbi:uncharacterized protein A1O9_11498 [Exophiala aquamarina CBS 119918]|uniref:Alpha/beta hydrolase n=1 Tax=Exophiala aquamarina CBS 119918 TaxID=1182545 RepID=A0A072NZ31_9EURO|nr:uncharacterized protein A1O9_11498 [Exophiala aquamarina CBS 119918]KEF52258.1 hypothetical protein A1O9_11498 [Exophiala aquamarina CBS 119918]
MALALESTFAHKNYESVESIPVGVESVSAKKSMTGQWPCVGTYYRPKGQDPEVAFMLTHYSADFSNHYLSGPLASRGFGVLGYGIRFRALEEKFVLDKALDDIAAGIKWLSNNTKAKKLIFIGNSGGGSLMAAFQATAEQTSSLTGADAFIFLNAHPGRADAITMYLDPSVIDEFDPTHRDSSLDMYDPVNGPPFSPEFQALYRNAQIQRNHRITAWAKAERERLRKAGISDRIFSVDRTFADLRFLDRTIDPSDRRMNVCFYGEPKAANNGPGLLARATTIETWLSMWSLQESKVRFELIATEFTLPTLVVQSTGDVGVFPSTAESIFNMVGSKNKELRLVPGEHFFEDGQENLEAVADLIAEWTQKTLGL